MSYSNKHSKGYTTREERTPLTYVRYYDSAFDYHGVGVLAKEQKGNRGEVTHIIGAELLLRYTVHPISSLPAYPVMIPDGYIDPLNGPPYRIPSWILSFDVSDLDAESIHHIGLFFETLFFGSDTLAKRLEKCIASSVLPVHLKRDVILHTIESIASDDDNNEIERSSAIQKLFL